MAKRQIAHQIMDAHESTSGEDLYQRDYYTWAIEQSRALRGRNAQALDWENLAEEVDGLARSEARELKSRLEVLLVHLLKWRYQPRKRTASWRLTIREQRRRVRQVLGENPGLSNTLHASVASAYEIARLVAARETKRTEQTFPPSSPWNFDQVSSEDFWPSS